MLREVTLLVAQNQAESLGDALIDRGALSITLEDADADNANEEPIFGEPGLEPTTCAWKRSRLKFLIDEKSNPTLLVKAAFDFIGQPPEPIESIVPVPETDWVKLTQSQFGPTKVSDRLWIVPSWCELPDARAVNIRLDPGVAFGTGAHPTTHLCLKWLDENVRSGLSVLDYGCGTGILAIAAAKLGAAPVVGTDIDPQAVEAACYNAKINAVTATFSLPETLEHRHFDIVIANILANPLKVLAPALVGYLSENGSLTLSGILAHQAQDIINTYEAIGVKLSVWKQQEDWICLTGKKQSVYPKESSWPM